LANGHRAELADMRDSNIKNLNYLEQAASKEEFRCDSFFRQMQLESAEEKIELSTIN